MSKKIKKRLFFSCVACAVVSVTTATSLSSVACVNNSVIVLPARPTNSQGLTAIEYDQEKYINRNSASLLITCEPNIDFLKKYFEKYLQDNEEYKVSTSSTTGTTKTTSSDSSDYVNQRNAYILIDEFNNALKAGTNAYKTYNIDLGTGWILDYSLSDSETSNLATYYLVTNTHVLNASYKMSFSRLISGKNYSLELDVPISSESVSSANIYMSQPQAGVTSTNEVNNLSIPANNTSLMSKYWYKTNITKDNINSSIIPVSSYTSSGTFNPVDPYDMSIKITIEENSNSSSGTYYYQTYNSKYTSTNKYKLNGSLAIDFSVLKIQANPSSFLTGNFDSQYTKSFEGLKEMFTYETSDQNVTSKSSYIAKLNYLNQLASKTALNKTAVDNLFLFKDYNTLNNRDVLSVAGFPVSQDSQNNLFSSTFNSNTISYSLTKTTGENDTIVGSVRPDIAYNYDGKYYFGYYDWKNNLLLNNVNLLPGSSGSMVVDSDYRITGIYWGVLSLASQQNVEGCTNVIYSKSNSDSIVYKFLKYVERNDKNSQLLKLFKNLNNFRYFND